MDLLKDKIEAFLDVGNGYGDGNGSGNGYGYGNGYGDGSGYGDGDGNGDGNGDGYGYGYGNGSGNGYGYGNGYGNGYGDGSGYGDGYGNGDGNGDGYGYGVKEFNGKTVYVVDGVPTIIESIKHNYAKGYTIRRNVELIPCYIAKVGNYFAHGETLKEALQSAQEKYDENKPLEERIADTIKKYPTLDTKVSHKELYILHHVLTGSCKFGRDEFAKSHGIDTNKGEMTMRAFIDLTRNAYGGDAIVALEKEYLS